MKTPEAWRTGALSEKDEMDEEADVSPTPGGGVPLWRQAVAGPVTPVRISNSFSWRFELFVPLMMIPLELSRL